MGRGKSQRSMELIDASREILEETHPNSIRGVAYRLFIDRGLIPSMAKTHTNRVSVQLKYARRQGIIPWDHVVDETREPEGDPGWENPEQLMRWAKITYRKNHWTTQPRRVEVWSEKGTVRGILAPVLEEYGVIFQPMHGHTSETILHDEAEKHRDDGRPLVVLYVGDWDPSGLHMSELDAPKRLLELSVSEWWVKRFVKSWEEAGTGPIEPDDLKAVLNEYVKIDLRRVALNEDDIVAGRLPSFSVETKKKDTRYRWFKHTYGRRCWEVDALNPNVLRERVEEAIRELIEWTAWERCDLNEAAEQKTIATVAGNMAKAKRGQATK